VLENHIDYLLPLRLTIGFGQRSTSNFHLNARSVICTSRLVIIDPVPKQIIYIFRSLFRDNEF
jgi:hypothetical protein